MAKITGVANNDTGDEAKAKINEAMASVEVGSEFSGDGNTGSVLKFLGRIYNTARTFYTYLSSTNLTANRTLTIPDKDITIAGLTDIQKGLQLAIDLSATTAGNPGTGLARFNNSDQSAVTALYVNNSEYGGNGSIKDFIGILNADSVIKLTAQGNRAKWVNYKVSSVADNSTYYTISLTVSNKGTDFESGDVVGVEVLNAGGSGGTVTIDSIPTYGSANAVSSGGTYTALSAKADKVSEATEGNVPQLDAEGNLEDSGVAAAGLLNASNVDVSDIDTGESKILTVEKQSDGTAAVGTAISQLDKLASSALDDLLDETADWDGDEITLTGNNLTGGLGENGQEYYIGSDFFLCISHYVGTTSTDGTATWRRNRGQDCLTEGLTQDDLIIAELQSTDDWSDADFKTITNKSKQGTWWRDVTGGYLYMCIDTSNGWTRVGTPDTITLEITSTSHPTLTTNLAAYDFATNGLYDESTDTSNESAEQGQEYWDETNNAVYKRNMNGYWAKIFG